MFHKIEEVIPKENLIIVVKFKNGIIKKYNIKEIIDKWEIFNELYNDQLFKMVKVDPGGLGISWNEKIDLSSEEIWENGIEI